jgi:hypothetical protein
MTKLKSYKKIRLNSLDFVLGQGRGLTEGTLMGLRKILLPLVVLCLFTMALPPFLGPVWLEWETSGETEGCSNPPFEEWASPRRVSRQVAPRRPSLSVSKILSTTRTVGEFLGQRHHLIPLTFKSILLRNGLGRPLNP